MTRLPPVPPENQSPMGTGDAKSINAHEASKPSAGVTGNPDQQGRTGNIKQNTTNQGYQQDR
ncbi:conserved hypothetical protein [Bradyrhizobium sp. ORS 375]|uniref:hypothetical protein n=1 Tax=Bradyrhizobium sp. (strain ORS 375) TaxID=566679 RepID=UPI00024063D4|nr:hypothetical protein [Bradyrhizobium sp. ORS 375]CCD94484.1 conserved hypothetical protein [Bradyrhizobium sp. ORS 375]